MAIKNTKNTKEEKGFLASEKEIIITAFLENTDCTTITKINKADPIIGILIKESLQEESPIIEAMVLIILIFLIVMLKPMLSLLTAE